MDNINRTVVVNDNADPITGEPGSHPIGTAIGGTGGAAAGAAIGAIGGPLGMLIGGAIGAIVGGVAGSSVGEMLDPTVEYEYWQETYTTRPYYQADFDYDTDYHPAYAVGYASRTHYPKTTRFEEVEAELEQRWYEVKGDSRMTWLQAKDMVRDGWEKTNARLHGETYQPKEYVHYAGHREPIQPVHHGEDKPHPVATGTGALSGVAAGAAIGAAGGPIGSVVGGAVGAVVGATAGNAVANAFEGNMEEDAYWRTQHVSTEYYNPHYDYDTDYRNAYGYGYAQRKRYGNDQVFELVEQDLQRDWIASRGNSRLEWADARFAVRDAWNRPML